MASSTINTKGTNSYKKALQQIEICLKAKANTLDLSAMSLILVPPEIGKLTHLRELILSNNQLNSIPPEITKLTKLTQLHLRNNQFSALPEYIYQLTNLELLGIESNDCKGLTSGIGLMTKLKRLLLSSNEISYLPPEIIKLTKLEELDLASNQFFSFPIEVCQLRSLNRLAINENSIDSIPQDIGLLSSLKHLSIGDNQLSHLPSEITQLTHLQELSLHNNNFTIFPTDICALPALSLLYLGCNKISNLPHEIGQLTSLRALYLFDNRLSELLPAICQLRKLHTLHIGGNQINNLPFQIGEIKELKHLFLQRNQLSSIPSQFGNLTKLEQLDLSYNRINTLPSQIGQLVNLIFFEISNNHLNSLPSEIEQLAALNFLFLNNNQLNQLPLQIGQLKELSELYLHNNNLIDLPISLRDLSQLRYLSLHNNPRLHLSPSVLGPKPENAKSKEHLASAKSILDYYFEALQGNTRQLNEVKLILVGRGGAGKTSTVQALQGLSFNDTEESTPGIALCDWEMTDCKGSPITAHVWDFAGQVITHSLHQFFFSVRSVYVVVLTGRENSERDDAEYWLRLIKAFGTDEQGNGPSVIIALNKWDTVGCRPSVDREALQERYPFIQGFVEIDCKTKKGISKLRATLCRTVEKLPWVREPFPAAWDDVRRALSIKKRGKKRAHLTYVEYRELCAGFGVVDSGQQDSLAEILHNLGAALNYRNDSRLREATVLQPEWLTKNVYSLIRRAEKKAGVLLQIDIEVVLRAEKDLDMRTYLLQIMERFEIAYAIRATDDTVERWLVPQALPDRQPKEAADFAATPDATRLRYTYAALPEGLVARAVVRLHDFIERVDDTLLQWASGVILYRDGAYALVRAEPQDRQVTITVTGPVKARQQLAGLCQLEMRGIHSEIRGLDPFEETKIAETWVAITTLEEDERRGQKTGIPTKNQGTIAIDPTEANNAYSEKAARNDLLWKPQIFISYSKSNVRQRQQLESQLKVLKNEGLLHGVWHDRMIDPGDFWDEKIQHELTYADIFIFLMSTNALATDYIVDQELPRALELQTRGQLEIVPIIVEKCRWSTWNKGALGKLNALPEKALPLNKWKPASDGWSSVADGLEKICRKLIDKKH